jgi:hypothetical protein
MLQCVQVTNDPMAIVQASVHPSVRYCPRDNPAPCHPKQMTWHSKMTWPMTWLSSGTLSAGLSYMMDGGENLSYNDHGCHHGRFWMKIPVRTSFSSGGPRTSPGRPPASTFTTRTRFYPWTGFTVHGHGKNLSARKREKNKKIYIFFFGTCCRLGKREIFGFRFRFPIPKLPELHGLCEQSREKKKVFSA